MFDCSETEQKIESELMGDHKSALVVIQDAKTQLDETKASAASVR
jgi:hypothetical protein